MVLVGSGLVSLDTDLDPDSRSRLFLYGSGSASRANFDTNPDPKGVQFEIRSRISYLYSNLKVSNPPDSKKTQLFYLRLKSENLNKVPV